jgi:hypothetical protein
VRAPLPAVNARKAPSNWQCETLSRGISWSESENRSYCQYSANKNEICADLRSSFLAAALCDSG